jgi:hypothetical protein
MIYDTTFSNLLSGSLESAISGYGESLLVIYEGDMPTEELFRIEYAVKYRWSTYGNTEIPINSPGTNVLLSYGATYYSTQGQAIKMLKDGNKFYYDSSVFIDAHKHKEGIPSFGLFVPNSKLFQRNNRSFDIDNDPWMLVSVSDTSGDGIVKLFTTDLTLSETEPTLVSFDFEIGMGV